MIALDALRVTGGVCPDCMNILMNQTCMFIMSLYACTNLLRT